MKYLPPIIELHDEGPVVGFGFEDGHVAIALRVFVLLSPDIGVQGLEVIDQLVGAIRPGAVPFLLAPWVTEPEQPLSNALHLVVLINDLNINAEDVDDGVGVALEHPTGDALWEQGLIAGGTKGRAAHEGVVLVGLNEELPELLLLLVLGPLALGALFGHPDLPGALLLEDDLGLSIGCHVGQTIVNEP